MARKNFEALYEKSRKEKHEEWYIYEEQGRMHSIYAFWKLQLEVIVGA
jgi:hypothetical protein